MAIPTKNVPAKKVEAELVPAEGTRERPELVPSVDIIERRTDLYLVADLPGTSEKDVDINVEKNVLTITARVKAPEARPGRTYLAEYEMGDWRRSFTLSNDIDQGGIEATYRDGVLRLRLPKAKQTMPRKITVKTA